MTEPEWLTLARELQAIAQTGLTYARDPFDIQRYGRAAEIAAAMMAAGSGEPLPRLLDLFRQDVGHATPRVGVRGAAFRDGKVLLARESEDGRWSLPGGWADVNCTAAGCIEREIHEETGFAARAVKLAAVWDRRGSGGVKPFPYHVYNLFFVCEITGGAARTSVETSEIGFFAEDALPELSTGRVTAPQIRRMFAHHREPSLPTEFE